MSAQATESKHFREQKARSLNSTVNGQEPWKLDIKYTQQAMNAIERVRTDIDEGIVLHLQARRMQELERLVADKCYTGNDFSFLQAQKCEEYHYKNDFKLNLLNSFFSDHMTKHYKAYESCWRSPEFNALSSTEEKDRAFVECHNRWIQNLRGNVSHELDVKARELFQ